MVCSTCDALSASGKTRLPSHGHAAVTARVLECLHALTQAVQSTAQYQSCMPLCQELVQDRNLLGTHVQLMLPLNRVKRWHAGEDSSARTRLWPWPWP